MITLIVRWAMNVLAWITQALQQVSGFRRRLYVFFKALGEKVLPSLGKPPEVDDRDEGGKAEHPVLVRLRRTASLELFDWLGLTHVPGQFWPLVEKHRDPIAALKEFVRGIGCSVRKVRQRDPGEIERMQTVIDLLELGGPLFENLNESQKAELQRRLFRKDYEALLRVAKSFADLQGLRIGVDRYRTPPTLRAFEVFAEEVRKLAERPFEVTDADVKDAREIAEVYFARIEPFRECMSRYKDLVDTMPHWFPPEWVGTVRGDEIGRLAAICERISQQLTVSDYGLDTIDEQLSDLNGCVDRLQQHRLDSETADYGTSSGAGAGDSGVRRALKFFKLAEDTLPDCKAIKTAYRDFIKRWHPDKCSAKEAEGKTKQANEHYNLLRLHFKCP